MQASASLAITAQLALRTHVSTSVPPVATVCLALPLQHSVQRAPSMRASVLNLWLTARLVRLASSVWIQVSMLLLFTHSVTRMILTQASGSLEVALLAASCDARRASTALKARTVIALNRETALRATTVLELVLSSFARPVTTRMSSDRKSVSLVVPQTQPMDTIVMVRSQQALVSSVLLVVTAQSIIQLVLVQSTQMSILALSVLSIQTQVQCHKVTVNNARLATIVSSKASRPL